MRSRKKFVIKAEVVEENFLIEISWMLRTKLAPSFLAFEEREENFLLRGKRNFIGIMCTMMRNIMSLV